MVFIIILHHTQKHIIKSYYLQSRQTTFSSGPTTLLNRETMNTPFFIHNLFQYVLHIE